MALSRKGFVGVGLALPNISRGLRESQASVLWKLMKIILERLAGSDVMNLEC